MSRKVMSAAARTRARRRELRAELARVTQIARERMPSAIAEGLVEGRVVDGEIIIEAETDRTD